MKNFFSLLLFLSVFVNIYSQDTVKGKVIFEDSGISYPIGGSSIYWQGTQSGTISDDNGEFEIQKIELTNKLVISYIGFKTQIILIEKDKFYNVVSVNGFFSSVLICPTILSNPFVTLPIPFVT